MADYLSRQTDAILKHIAEKTDLLVEQLVSNTQMSNDDVQRHRGRIFELRDMAFFLTKDLPKQLNEA